MSVEEKSLINQIESGRVRFLSKRGRIKVNLRCNNIQFETYK